MYVFMYACVYVCACVRVLCAYACIYVCVVYVYVCAWGCLGGLAHLHLALHLVLGGWLIFFLRFLFFLCPSVVHGDILFFLCPSVVHGDILFFLCPLVVVGDFLFFFPLCLSVFSRGLEWLWTSVCLSVC